MMSDAMLIEQLKEGNLLAFNKLYERSWDQLYQAAYKVLLDEALAKDAVQEVFLDFWIRKERLNIHSIDAYLYQAVRFQALKQLKKSKALDIHELHFQNLLKANDTEEQLNMHQLEESLGRSLEKLPEKYREVFEMSRVQNLSNKEIADKLQLSQRTVEWYLHSVLKHLKTTLTTFLLLITFC